MASEHLVTQFLNICGTIDGWASKKEELVRRPEKWGTINFEEIEKDLESMFWLVTTVKELPLEIVPDRDLGPAYEGLQEILLALQEINNFEISVEPKASRDKIAKKITSQFERVVSSFGIWLPLLALRAGVIEDWTSKQKNEYMLAAVELKRNLDAAKERLREIEQTLQVSQTAASKAGAVVFTQEFDKESKAAKRRSWGWLAATTLLVGVALTMPILIIFGEFGELPDSAWEAAYMTGWRVIAVGVLFCAATWSGRIVLANMNLASVNKHRGMSLQTLQAFHRAADDPAAKDAVVLEAARAVYENVPTGYIARQSAQQGGGARTLELIKNANRGSPESGSGG